MPLKSPMAMTAHDDERPVRRVAALGTAFAAVMLTVMIAVNLHQWGLRPPLDPVPWLLLLAVALMLSMLVTGVLVLRTDNHLAHGVFLLSALFGVPLALLWGLVMLSD